MSASPPEGTASSSSSDAYEKNVNLLHDSAKWILTVFAAIAGILFAGLSLSNIGKVEPVFLIIALLAATVGLFSVARIVWLAATVLTSRTVTEITLRAYAAGPASPRDIKLNDRILLDGYDSVDNFLNDYKRIGEEYELAVKNNDTAKAQELRPQVERLVKTRNTLLPIARYALVLHSFNNALRWMFVWGAVAAASIVLFAWATSQPVVTDTVFHSPPSEAVVTLTSAGKKALGSSLGEACVSKDEIPVILLSVENGDFEVVSLPSADCEVVKFTINTDSGNVQTVP